MLSTLILKNQKGLARFNELACPLCKWIIEDKNQNKLTCLHCNKVWKIHQLEIIPLTERIPESQIAVANDVFSLLWEIPFLDIVLWSTQDWVILKSWNYRFVWEYKIWKRLRRVKRYPKTSLLEKFDYELWLMRVWVPVTRMEFYTVLLELYDWLNNAKTPNLTLKRNSSKYKSDWNSDKEHDPFMENITAMVSAFIRWYENMYEKILSEDVTDEDFDKFQEMLGTWITDEEISQLKNWEPVVLSSLVPAIEYLLSKSVRPSVSLLKSSLKINLINDLPSTHPFYDLLHEKPL